MKKLCLKVMLGEIKSSLFIQIIIYILLIWGKYWACAIFLALITNILFPSLHAFRLHFKLKKMPKDIQITIENNIDNPEFFYWYTYILFEDCIINLYKPGYVKIRDIDTIAVNADFQRQGGFCCFLFIITKKGEKIKFLHKIEGVLYFECYENIIPYLLEKNPNIKVIDNFWHLKSNESKKSDGHNKI